MSFSSYAAWLCASCGQALYRTKPAGFMHGGGTAFLPKCFGVADPDTVGEGSVLDGEMSPTGLLITNVGSNLEVRLTLTVTASNVRSEEEVEE
jgi:hypothetical protein